MPVLVVNSGSSSLKYRLIDPRAGAVLARGLVERVGTAVPSHRAALELALAEVPAVEVEAVGHRVVHGGERFREATVLDAGALAALDALTPLAPLHNPPALEGVRACLDLLPGVPNVGVFDTAFHATLPREAFVYALPLDLYDTHGVRKYGFHGTSHAFVSREAARLLGRAGDLALRVVTLHLGNGASGAAVLGGRSVDTTMGFTPLAGLVMGTRSGDVDPAVALWLAEREGPARASDVLNRESGLLGLSGRSNDLRDLHRAREAGDDRAALALEVMAHRLVSAVGGLAATLGGLDALVFTGGVGENDAWTRAAVVRRLAFLGLALDEGANARGETFVTSSRAPAALVVPTDEEGEIARETARVLGLG